MSQDRDQTGIRARSPGRYDALGGAVIGRPAGGQDARFRLETVNPGRTWLVYTLIRVGIFAAVLAILLLLQITPWLAAIIAALISLCISIIVLRKPRDEASRSLYAARENRGQAQSAKPAAGSEDEDVEDSAVDRTER